MVVSELIPELVRLREAGVSRVALDSEGHVTEVEFFESNPVPLTATEQQTEPLAAPEPEVPMGYANAAGVFNRKGQKSKEAS